MVCVWKGDEVYAYGETDSAGNVSFNIEPTSEGTMYLTACAHNSETYEAEVTVEGYYVTVELESFTGKRIKEGVRLDWSVTNDKDVDYFNLYRRVANAAAGIEPVDRETPVSSAADKAPTAVKRSIWCKVNEHPITGDNPYTYLDRSVSDGEYEYKLEAVLNDTAESLGNTVVSGDVPVPFGLKIAPNPAKSVVKLGVGLPEKTAVKLTLYDLTGRKIYEPVNGPMEAGEHNVAFDVSNLSAGVYIVRLDAGDMGVTVKRVVITR